MAVPPASSCAKPCDGPRATGPQVVKLFASQSIRDSGQQTMTAEQLSGSLR